MTPTGTDKGPYEFNRVRVLSGRADRVIMSRKSDGWELVARRVGRVRTQLDFGRTTPPLRSRGRRQLVLMGCTAVITLLGTTAAALQVPEWLHDQDAVGPSSPERVNPNADSDGDGLLDEVETDGWATTDGSTLNSDPRDSDSDGDGLPDGLEAGQLVGTSPAPVYASLSNPLFTDSDDDTVGDTDEYFLDMDPGVRDTDADGLTDGMELAFGSDPTSANGDGDDYSDAEEYARGSAPLGYDLTTGERVDAAEAGAKYGDCYACALDHGLNEEQVESVFYLTGQAGSGVAVYGDVRDLAYNLWQRRLLAAAVAAVGLVPVFGDAAKISATVSKFAARSDRAAGAAYEFVHQLPMDIQKRLPTKLLQRGFFLPGELAAGPRENVVYLWKGNADCPTYVGITMNFALRSAQHVRAGRCFIAEMVADRLTRGQAHAIEEACIVQGGLGTAAPSVQNLRHSIDPSRRYYADAVAWGTEQLKKLAVSCR